MKYLIDFYLFFFKGVKASSLTFIEKLLGVFVFLLFTFFLLICFELIIPIVFIVVGIIDAWPIISPKQFDGSNLRIISVCILVPIIEELVGRLWLVNNVNNTSLSLSVIFGLIFYKLFNKVQVWYLSIYTLITIFIVICLFFLIKVTLNKVRYIDIISSWHIKKITYVLVSAIIFALLHLNIIGINYEDLYLFPFFIGFYFTSGLVLGYVRLQYGFLYCCLLHIFYNSSLVLCRLFLV